MKTFSVLMVCTGNICRSPMAAGILTTSLPESLKPVVSVGSAGTLGLHGNRAEPFAVQAAARYGADIRDHRARLMDEKMVKSADLVLAMEKDHLYTVNQLLFLRCNYARLLGSFEPNRAWQEIEDPYGLPLEAYEACAGEIVDCLTGVVAHIEDIVGKKKR